MGRESGDQRPVGKEREGGGWRRGMGLGINWKREARVGVGEARRGVGQGGGEE